MCALGGPSGDGRRWGRGPDRPYGPQVAPVRPSQFPNDDSGKIGLMNARQPAAAPARRGRPPKVGRDQIVDAAAQAGLDSFTMQGLAEDLGVSPATLYSHVAGRDEVIALVESRLDHAIRGFATEATEWRGWLTDFAGLVRREFGSSASTVLTATRDEASMRIDVGEPGLRLLMAAGFSSVEAAYAVWLVVRVAITASSGAEASFSRFLEPTAELVDAAGDADTYAALRQVHDDLTTSDVRDTFAFDLEIVLDGIAARLERATTGD